MSAAAADARAWQNVGAVLRGRRERPSRADIAYTIYATIMVAIVVVFPVIRATAIGFTAPELTLPTVALAPFAPAALALLSTALVGLGRVRGLVLPRQPFIEYVVASPIARSLTLHGTSWAARGSVTGLATLIAVMLVWAGAISEPITFLGTLAFVLAAALAALQLSTFWLIGQIGGRLRARVLLTLALLSAVLIVVAAGIPALAGIPSLASIVVWSGPWGWLTLVWPAVTAGPNVTTLLALVLLGAGCLLHVALTPHLLDRLAREDLSRQASRWSAIATLAMTGDVTSAAAKLKAVPRRGRHWRVTFRRHPVLAIVTRDLVGIARFPGQALVWAVLTAASGALLAFVFAQPFAPLAYATPVLAYLAIGGWASGLKTHGFTLAPGSPFGYGVRRRIVSHAVVPATIGAILMLIGALAVTLIDTSLSPAALVWILFLAVFLTVIQAFTSVKGPLPLELLTPIPTPMGEMSLVGVGFWLADAVLIVLVAAGSATSFAATGSPAAAPALLIVAALMLWWTHARTQRLIRPVA